MTFKRRSWMAERYISLALLFPALALAIGAWLMWTLHDSPAAIQTSKWRRIATILGLLGSDCQIFRIRHMLEHRRTALLNRNSSGLLGKRTGGQTSDSARMFFRYVVLVPDNRPA